jgi:hypothetical protein
MSFLDSIVSDIGSALSDPGKLVTDALDAVLPDRLKSVGDAAGGLVDLVLGHEPQALALFKEGVKDLPQLSSSQTAAATGAATDVGTAAAEPAPPPTTGGSSTPADTASLLALSPDDFLKTIASGAVPADVASDPAAMLQIQSRANSIAAMNQLITSMLSTTHQMQMSIAQNIRA